MWSWQDDNNKWIPYTPQQCLKFEKAWNSSKTSKSIKIDAERCLDLANMIQRRYDDPSRQRKVKREDPEPKPEEEEEEEDAVWQWAGDSTNGSQDVWIDYANALQSKIELAYEADLQKFKIDDERFVDLSDPTQYYQRRFDDPEGKVREVRRVVTSSKCKREFEIF
jgi:hypothetical protein